MHAPSPLTSERAVAEAAVAKAIQFACAKQTVAPRTPPPCILRATDITAAVQTSTTRPKHSVLAAAFVQQVVVAARQSVLDKSAPNPPIALSATAMPSSKALLPCEDKSDDVHAQPTSRTSNGVELLSLCREDGPSSSRQKRSAPSAGQPSLSSAVSLFEATDGTPDAFHTHVPNLITQLALYPVASNAPPNTPRQLKPKKQVLPPVVATPALSHRTKVAAEVYLAGSSDSIVVAKPHHVARHVPLEPLVFKGGRHKRFLHDPSKPTNSPRRKKLEQQYGALEPKRSVPHVPIHACAPSQVSGFCRQCLLVGDMCKLADCRDHNYFRPHKPTHHHPHHPGP
ncbi:hypothetical protein H310_04646 [Aphanomyces invadans]|uniref:Uncharacterized protein n=1 Tax=Aphanomyces invadans TaxID=157072 RepID=A0A024UFE4_9STRA|nr:hypothetical protein H310_04646 [Aphanomyces invadans]ETW04353.1 hypothetical protein H310_04646 [Aphanomyces invadans]|eukprot:XP_008867309.1 hypothetical protein H310_04646 [Aphanomyces invadans]